MSTAPETLTLDSTSIYTAALNSISSQIPAPSLPLPTLPSTIPQPKLIPKTRFIVDGFKHAGDFSISYFLSHFHSDHYTGLSPNWTRGVIYCSSITARLLVEVLQVPAPFVVSLPLSKQVLIDGCEVFLVDANHCPGAVQFLFKIPVHSCNGKFERYVHTGDFRYCDSMKLDHTLNAFVGADAVFLDTTYCNPKYVFPSQEEAIDYIVGVIESSGVENEGSFKSVLFLVATYVIGKEKILMEIARRCQRKIHVENRKMLVLRILGHGDGVFTEDESETDIHVVGWNVLGETWPFFRPNFVRIQEIMTEKGYSKVVGFVPTGWSYEVKRNKFPVRKKDSFEIHLVPYSEHSNYDELREYVKFLKPKCVIPTVGIDVEKLDSKHANAMRKHFAGLVDEMAIKQDFLMGFHRVIQGVDENIVKKPACDIGISEIQNEPILSDLKGSKDGNLENIEESFPQNESKLQGLEDIDEDAMEESIKELQDFLPSWVNRSQMMDLLRISERNLVDAVSHFYEHETEFHEQVVTSESCASISQEICKNEFSLPFKLTQSESSLSQPLPLKSLKRNDIVSLSKSPSQNYKSSSRKKSATSGISPGKKKRNTEIKSSKRAKLNSKMDSSGSKQCTITKFFSKTVPPDSKSENDGAAIEYCHNDKNAALNAITEPYKDEIDEFIRIVNGNESLQSHAASILQKTKGDINRALDVYFNHANEATEVKQDIHGDSSKGVKSQCVQKVVSSQDSKSSKKWGAEVHMVLNGPSMENIAENYVSLPPEKYSPLEHACWRSGQHAPYLHLARTFEQVEEEKGKVKATSMLCNMFRSLLALSPEDVLPAMYLCTNKIAPDHENIELNIGGSIVIAALEEACGAKKAKIQDLYKNLGDLGDVAQVCRQTQSLLAPPATLTIQSVFSTLKQISVQTGSGSTIRKKSLVLSLLRSCREKEMKFIVRTLVRNLRIGAMMRTVLPAFAQAIAIHSSSSKDLVGNMKEHLQRLSTEVVEAYNILPSLDLLVPSLMEKGTEFSSMILSMVPGIPIKPMLAKITNGASQVLNRFQNKAFTCEYKYDGQRAQIHRLADGSVRIFSRNGDETTRRFPDVVDIIKESCNLTGQTFILDAEVVAIDRKNDSKLMSFQELSSRERGSKDSLITLDKIKVDICIFVFDIMFANGAQLLNLPLQQRRKYLKDLFGEGKGGYLEYAREMTVEADDSSTDNEATLTRINCFLNDALQSSCEGIMVKSLDVDAGYTPSKRSDAWLKVKKDYVEGLSDSLDLVPIGAWYGNGRKAGWYSPFLMACYNPDTEEYQSVCRAMSGFSDAFYKEMKDFFSGDKILGQKPPYYQTAEVPDVWFSPELVWEIRGAEFTVSPVHHAAMGLVHPSRGISVRFPRFIRSVADRNPEECSIAADIAEMFSSQTRKMDVGNEPK
nr:DNA ligase 6 isoform X1 [Ipomoea batatas]